jgi:hypothetical protein
MSQIEQNEQQDEPLDPAVEAVRRKMIRLQVVSGAVMFISLMAVFGAVVYKAMGTKSTPATTSSTMQVPTDGPISATASLPEGFVLANTSYAGGDLVFEGRTANGTRKALVFNIASGRFIADVTIDAR